MADFMVDLWANLSNKNVYEAWAGSKHDPIYGITSEKGYINNQPLWDYLYDLFRLREVQKRAVVSAVDSKSGAYTDMNLFDEPGATPTSMEYKVSSVVGSASIPFVFPPRDMTPYGIDKLLIDGGSGWNNNMVSGIE
jgi:predicted acylesterase/phospholipase RssA